MLLILVSASTYSQRIRTIGSDTFVAFTREQAKAINDTFISQKQTIKKLKQSDSLYVVKEKQYSIQDSTKRVNDSITYYQQIIPILNEMRTLLVSQTEEPFKFNIEIGAGGGLSTYFGAYRSFASMIDGAFYIPSGAGVLKLNVHKHFTQRTELFQTKILAGPLYNTYTVGTFLLDYNLAPNTYSIRVGIIPTVSVGFNMFGLSKQSPVVGASIKGYFTRNTSIEINVRYTLTNIDNIGANDHVLWGHLMLVRRLY
jgi:hypothetical protein